ncbi:MAG: ERF family protein [Caldilineaceae bacterium]|nr:ERF family protein [Caldilineaceae bacterium]
MMDTHVLSKSEAGSGGVRDIAVSERTADTGSVVVAAGAMSESAALISMLERAARDPNVDMDKMERLWAMKERADADRARRAYDAAFAEMQTELPEIEKKGMIIIRDKNDREKIIQSTPYALWDDTNRVIKPILTNHGFGLSFRITQTESRLTATAVLSHRDGHRETTEFSAPIDATGSKNNVQGWGSSFSYGKRYAATALLNITTRGEDDDGKAAGDTAQPVSEDDLKQFRDGLKSKGVKEGDVCALYSVGELEDLTRKQFTDAVARLARQKVRK